VSDDERARRGDPRPLFDVGTIMALTGARLLTDGPAPSAMVTGVEVDSRLVRRGDLFCALAGERVDGHAFTGCALQAGAIAALVSRDPGPEARCFGRALLIVPDVLLGLTTLARHHRGRFSLPIVAVTGSVGKTTTKDLIASVLAPSRRVLASRGNLNTDIGLPLTLFDLGAEHEVACLEMGMRGPGEIARLAALARPSFGVITNVGPVHLELLGCVEAIGRAKEELLWALTGGGTAILNADDPLVAGLAERHRSRLARVITFGLERPAEVVGRELEACPEGGVSFSARQGGRDLGRFSLPLGGRHSVLNALAALATGIGLGLEPQAMRGGLACPRLSAMRQETLSAGGVRLVNDAYNASPASMAASLDLLTAMRAARGGRAVAILGDMLELGDFEETAHREIGQAAAAANLDLLIAVGPRAGVLAQEARRGLGEDRVVYLGPKTVRPNLEAANLALGFLASGDSVLIKASRGLRFEEIVKELVVGLSRRRDDPGPGEGGLDRKDAADGPVEGER
jgi:UDP-N-acetylmuramoyl-tripeptide--D-alanyl-D-alanine ligase